MNVVRCDYDGCEDTRPADDVTPHSWLHVEQPRNWTLGEDAWDFCCHAHLASWATWQHQLKQEGARP